MPSLEVDILKREVEPETPEAWQPPQNNLADDAELVKKVMERADAYYRKYRAQRSELEEIWKQADYMFKCGQAESWGEERRAKQDRLDQDSTTADNATKTRVQRIGSTLFFRQVREVAAQFYAVLKSSKDPYKFTPIYNPEVFYSKSQADSMATQHDLLMRWTRDNDNFITKSIELAYMLVKYGNLPICMYWKRRFADVPVRKPVYERPSSVPKNMMDKLTKYFRKKDLESETEDDAPKIIGYDYGRERKLIENLPTLEIIQNDNFFADQSIGTIQKQQCILTSSLVGMSDIYDCVRTGEFSAKMVKTISHQNQYTGRSDDDLERQKQLNQGMDNSVDDSDTGMFQQFEAFMLLPIDEEKGVGSRWDPENTEPKKYWVTFIDDPGTGICVKIQRNDDPHDEFPFEMLSCMPDDTDRLYKMSYAEAIQGNFNEQCIAKKQSIDSKTLQNNRPLKRVRGQVYTDDLTYKPDAVFDVENMDSLQEMNVGQVIDNTMIEDKLNRDSDEAVGTGPTIRGVPMGGRTSSSEATNASESAKLPFSMNVKYVFDKYLKFHARKGIGLWHLNADPDQVLMITDESQYPYIMPDKLFGDFNITINIVEDYEQSVVQTQNLTFAATNLLPLFIDVFKPSGKAQLAVEIFDKILHLDIADYVDVNKEADARKLAKMENRIMMDLGKMDMPQPGELHSAHLPIHEAEAIEYRGSGNPNLEFLLKHIELTKQLAEQDGKTQDFGTPMAGPGNTTPGQVSGNAVSALMGQQNVG